MQLAAAGRSARPADLARDDPIAPYVAPSSIKLQERPETEIAPRPLTVQEIQEFVEMWATAASNAVFRAGFDGVEIHGMLFRVLIMTHGDAEQRVLQVPTDTW